MQKKNFKAYKNQYNRGDNMITHKVKSISEYLSIIEELGISEYVYRGQNEPYYSIEASGFRPYLGGWDSDKIYDMEHLHSAFYNRIIGQISENQKKHFLAFCQHHGIPTNLVDMSYSPLVALFFACDGKNVQRFSIQEILGSSSLEDLENDNTVQKMFIHNLLNQANKPFYSPYAQTYLLSKQRLINITDIIIKLKGRSLFEEILVDKDISSTLSVSIHNHFQSIDITILQDWINNLLYTYCEINEAYGIYVWERALYEYIKDVLSKNQNLEIQDYQNILKVLSDASSMQTWMYPSITQVELSIRFKDRYTIASLYIGLLIDIVYGLKNFPSKINIDLDIYFTYQPPELFSRISSQQSFFVYQPYIFTNDGVYDYCELNIQSINPDVLIEVESYSTISEELDLIGINNGTIYGDIDNIAKALLKSSGKLLKK